MKLIDKLIEQAAALTVGSDIDLALIVVQPDGWELCYHTSDSQPCFGEVQEVRRHCATQAEALEALQEAVQAHRQRKRPVVIIDDM